MLNKNFIIVFDFETGSLPVETLEPIQVAAMALDPRTLRSEGQFCSLMRPLDMNNLEEAALRINGKKKEELAEAPEQEVVWRQFASFVSKFKRGKTPHGAPLPAGKNIKDFDLRIVQRLCKTYGMVDAKGTQNLFNNRRCLELEDLIFLWFEQSDDLKDMKMDTLRPYFGLSSEGAHDAMVDVQQTSELICRFLRLHRGLKGRTKADGSPLIKFQGSCAGAA